MRKLREAIACAVVCASALAWVGCTEARPDVILMVVDTLRADHLGAYGYARETSPNLDAFASEAILFEKAVAPAPWTLPSLASMLTGTYPSVHGLRAHEGPLRFVSMRKGLSTLPGMLKAGGYRTVALVTNPWLVSRNQGLREGLDVFEDLGMVSAEEVHARAREELESSADAEDAKPLFLYLHYMDVHGPYNRAGAVTELGPVASRYQQPLSEKDLSRLPGYITIDDASGLEAYVEAYDQGIRTWDAAFGAFATWLRETARLDKTIVVVVSDHGEEFLEHGGWNHGDTLYQEQLFVPWIMRLPGHPAARRDEAIVSLVDIAPTLLRAVGLPVAPRMNGWDVLGEGSDPARWVFAETQALLGRVKYEHRAAALRGGTKIIGSAKSQYCFDLDSDPDELHPIEVGAGCDAALFERVREWRDDMRDQILELGRQTKLEPDEDETRRLKALGYVE